MPRKFRIRRPLLDFSQRSICKLRQNWFLFWIHHTHCKLALDFLAIQSKNSCYFIANDSFSNFETCLVSKSQDCQSKHRGRDWRLVSNLQLRISSLSLRAPWTCKKLWTLHGNFLACTKIIFCSHNIWLGLLFSLMISANRTQFWILFTLKLHSLQTICSAASCIAWIGSD